ncbi:Neuroepithelial cell-transforming gene 1 protein [Geodia barretti]|uniref:Neuroepithelial cell-transforming gene 1 protein n=1 Tax=Geodia barretti TaxID=519541 RepID=A0AA35X791_GEOBA|nr:Neuroepithelial cell-transforming gene 1 protein [Geodia barretti]
MDSPSVPSLDVRDIDVRLTPRAVKSCPRLVPPAPSHSVLEQMSLCNFPGGVPESEEGGEREGVMRTRKRSREDLDTQSVDLHFTRSFSFSRDSPLSPTPKYRPPSIARTTTLPKYCPPSTLTKTLRRRKSNKRQLPANWVDCVRKEDMDGKYSREEVKRQEALYSIFKTEAELVEDLRMIINIFYHPLLRLNLISEEDHCKIFGNIQIILTLHEDLMTKLEELRSTGCHGECIDSIGDTLLQWSSTLSPYADYCANLVTAKQTLEAKRQDPPLEDFLQRCLDSEFSRKIDLWTFLDGPRSRIMKYPILLKEVRKKTPSAHKDYSILDEATVRFEEVLKEIDRRTGVAKCLDVVSRLEYIHDDQRCQAIDDSTQILCSGVLRNKSGSKLHVFLLDEALVLTRPSTRSSALAYQVYRQPIPVASLEVEDVADGDTKISSGSFRGTLRASGGSGSKNLIKVSCRDPTVSRHSHTLQANGDFDKKAWLDAFQQILPNIIRHNKVTTV